MKHTFTYLIVLLLACQTKAQLFQHELIGTYSIAELVQLRDDLGVPEAFVPINFEVDVYKVLYNTPYRELDSLVQASGAIFVPRNTTCPLPIASYAHGTQSNRHNTASNLSGGQWEVSLMLAARSGYMICNPDYLGLGDADPKVKLHPYVHAFSQGHTMVNIIRSARQLSEILTLELNGQIFLFGYSQGGFVTAATHKLIEEEFPEEFEIGASSAMSGPYDLIDAQVDLMVSHDEYATPGYLPYIIYAYKELYPELLSEINIDEVFVSPYDTLLPPLFYSGDYSIGYINGVCEPVPRDMINPTFMADFENDVNHPLRQALAESHLLDWAPQAPIKLLYCNGDEQVTYLNSELAYDNWTGNGAPNVTKQDLGNLTHGECAEIAFINTMFYFDMHKTCNGSVANSDLEREKITAYPNPANETIKFEGIGTASEIVVMNAIGQRIIFGNISQGELNVSSLENGIYFFEIKTDDDKLKVGKFNILRN